MGLVCCSAGVRPRDELAKACGLKMGGRGGVHVDERQRTSDASIWAVGEVASIGGGMCYGLSAPGRHQAQVCVANMLDKAGPRMSRTCLSCSVDGVVKRAVNRWFAKRPLSLRTPF